MFDIKKVRWKSILKEILIHDYVVKLYTKKYS